MAYAGVRSGGLRGRCGYRQSSLGCWLADWGGAGLAEFSVAPAGVGRAGGGFYGAGWGGEAARADWRVLWREFWMSRFVLLTLPR